MLFLLNKVLKTFHICFFFCIHHRFTQIFFLSCPENTAITRNLDSTVEKPRDVTGPRESHIGPGSYYYFDSSHTLPRAQARKYDFPWDSLPKDWTTSVKLREISKRRKEDRQSSSGKGCRRERKEE